MFFTIFIIVLISQRLIELCIAKRNAQWIKKQGGYEVGREHYKYIVTLHILFFLSLLVEVRIGQKELAIWWLVPFSLFIITQIFRLWSILSLGRFWSTRIMILPHTKIKRKGPYRWLKHPNYMIVALEILVIPLIFDAYVTACLFTLFNTLLIGLVRIPTEEAALAEATDYREIFNKS